MPRVISKFRFKKEPMLLGYKVFFTKNFWLVRTITWYVHIEAVDIVCFLRPGHQVWSNWLGYVTVDLELVLTAHTALPSTWQKGQQWLTVWSFFWLSVKITWVYNRAIVWNSSSSSVMSIDHVSCDMVENVQGIPLWCIFVSVSLCTGIGMTGVEQVLASRTLWHSMFPVNYYVVATIDYIIICFLIGIFPIPF